MQDYIGWQKKILTQLEDCQIGRKKHSMYCTKGFSDYVGVIVEDGHAVVFIPEGKFFLNKERFEDCDSIIHSMMVTQGNTVKLFRDTNIMTGNKILRTIFTDDDGEEYFVDGQLLKYFKENEALTYWGTAPNNPIFIEDLGQLVGIVLPIHREAKK